jgi:hypothetical protein
MPDRDHPRIVRFPKTPGIMRKSCPAPHAGRQAGPTREERPTNQRPLETPEPLPAVLLEQTLTLSLLGVAHNLTGESGRYAHGVTIASQATHCRLDTSDRQACRTTSCLFLNGLAPHEATLVDHILSRPVCRIRAVSRFDATTGHHEAILPHEAIAPSGAREYFTSWQRKTVPAAMLRPLSVVKRC